MPREGRRKDTMGSGALAKFSAIVMPIAGTANKSPQFEMTLEVERAMEYAEDEDFYARG